MYHREIPRPAYACACPLLFCPFFSRGSGSFSPDGSPPESPAPSSALYSASGSCCAACPPLPALSSCLHLLIPRSLGSQAKPFLACVFPTLHFCYLWVVFLYPLRTLEPAPGGLPPSSRKPFSQCHQWLLVRSPAHAPLLIFIPYPPGQCWLLPSLWSSPSGFLDRRPLISPTSLTFPTLSPCLNSPLLLAVWKWVFLKVSLSLLALLTSCCPHCSYLCRRHPEVSHSTSFWSRLHSWALGPLFRMDCCKYHFESVHSVTLQRRHVNWRHHFYLHCSSLLCLFFVQMALNSAIAQVIHLQARELILDSTPPHPPHSIK